LAVGHQLALVNGQLGSYTSGAPAGEGYPEMMPRVTAMTVRDGKVCAIWDIANPTSSLLASWASSVAHGTRHASPERTPAR
jgi:RNA polymerase sigma-70 factor (ECF subfamily)